MPDRITRPIALLKPLNIFLITLVLIACRPEQPPAQRNDTTQPSALATAPNARPSPVPVTPGKELPAGVVNIEHLPGITLDLRYKTTNNFMGEDLYREYTGAYLHHDAAEKLEKAATFLSQEKPGWKLRVLDALRPREIQERMWEKVRGTRSAKYVADPRLGSGHNYGMSIDVTLEDEQGKEVDMGTPFDDFTPLAQPRNEALFLHNGKLTRAQYENRSLLRRVMKQAGFGPLLQEWWHFNARGMKTIKSRYHVVQESF